MLRATLLIAFAATYLVRTITFMRAIQFRGHFMIRFLVTFLVAISAGQNATAQSYVTVCVGEHVSNCVQPPKAFFDCHFKYQPGPINPRISLQICGHSNGKVLRVYTKPGNRCGYTFDRVWCDEALVSSLKDHSSDARPVTSTCRGSCGFID